MHKFNSLASCLQFVICVEELILGALPNSFSSEILYAIAKNNLIAEVAVPL